eukprot:c25297_g1_i1.p1 GENE.c25297_g1_i1~~c25297_g1_i1.p1  ORF type:complete len:177 (+),score=49.52 c25297_g1_i1:41-571(+)
MGNNVSLTDDDIKRIQAQTSWTEEDVKKLHRRFRKIDADKSGTITRDELVELPDVALNPLLDRFISIFDVDSDKNIDFVEFVTTLHTFSDQSNNEAKLQFMFRVYDMDNDGFIGNGELFQVLKMMVGDNLTERQLQQIVDKTMVLADKDQDGKLSYEEFHSIAAGIDIEDKLTIKF